MNKSLLSLTNKSAEELLSFLTENDIIDLDDVQNQMTKKFKETILKYHNHKIWKGTDNRYRTHVNDSTKKSGRRLIVKTKEEDLLSYLAEFYGLKDTNESDSRSVPTLEKIYPQWLEYKRLHTTAETYILRIDCDWKKYYAQTEIVKKPLTSLNKLKLDEWAHKLIKDHSMTKTQYYNVTVIMRQTLQYAVDMGILKENPFSAVHIDGKRMFRKVKKKADDTQVFLSNEIPAIQRLAWNDFLSNDKLLHRLAPLAILFQFQTGVRIGELCACCDEDVESENYIHIQRMYRYGARKPEIVEHTKTSYGDRKIFLTDLAKKYIQIAKEYKAEHKINSKYIFSVNDRPLSNWSVAALYRKYCQEIGIINKTSHKTRKTYISALIDGQVNINTVREMVGHADERTTLGNYCFDRSTENEKLKLIQKALIS
ncbi:MAG TPA: site-specific integrase [Candidatus Blautia stercorigallinarum]|uniref:Site-specific integrase n=1 Tax=Candidatus Blautia stercorigallinarum TaxID=2838501 RepID=A0A9D1PAM9_9FIRM|nr:site-specific integrase [uncultured Merdimonas sp.]HIV37745.1 site-specific integrase [Candidatus Blautia stercorigallinarum]